MKAWLAALRWPLRIALALLCLAIGLEARLHFRKACGDRAAGGATRHVCDWFDVVPPTPTAPVMLGDSDAAQRGGTHVAGDGETGQGLQIVDLKSKDASQLERILGRDLDGDGTVGKVTPRSARPPGETFGAGELLFADLNVPQLPRGGRAVATAPANGGKMRVDVIPGEVPSAEWIHQVRYKISGDLPVNGHTAGDELEISADWTIARTGPLYWGIEPYWRKLPALESQAVGKSSDWGVHGSLALTCRGFFDCAPE
ncbi:MAG: hypothetical protein ABI639_17475 [Thermoanaerobaculia bacterium]